MVKLYPLFFLLTKIGNELIDTCDCMSFLKNTVTSFDEISTFSQKSHMFLIFYIVLVMNLIVYEPELMSKDFLYLITRNFARLYNRLKLKHKRF